MKKRILTATGHGLYYAGRAAVWGIAYPFVLVTSFGHTDTRDNLKAILGVLLFIGIALTFQQTEYGLMNLLISAYGVIGVGLAVGDILKYG